MLQSRTLRHVRQAAAMLCGAAVGALLFSVHVATMVFRDMPEDRMTAGRIAGRAFIGAYGVAAFAAVAAVVIAFATRSRPIDRGLACAILVLAGLQLLWIAPAIVSHGSGWPGTFASLHAVGGAAHLLLAVLALLLAWRFLADPPDPTNARG